jgi:hypothetical protein
VDVVEVRAGHCMTIAHLAAGGQVSVPDGPVARTRIWEDHGPMHMQQPSRRVIAEPLSETVPKRPVPEPPPSARPLPVTARSAPVGSS